MKLLNSCFSAFLMYSRVPVPKVEWKEENRRYALCFFPLVGAVIGGLLLLWQWLGGLLEVHTVMFCAVAVLIPIFVTGGIHMDGYMDVNDAKACLGDREKMLAVMKDSRVGAFAVIHLVFYILFQIALFSEVKDVTTMAVIAIGFIQSRAYSGLAAVSFKNAKGEGSLVNFSRPAHKRVTVCVELVFIFGCWLGMILLDLTIGLCGITAGLLSFVYYRGIAYRHFGGITGDLAGYFLQVCELCTMVCVVAGNYCAQL
ncbi:MAG: adenosylcobinamide-GDP ribazoletransferase [Lachnospiraceae bacterium]|nr:adenosylcobinamide-GDP ribazoletransferase [Lachnospiraceae bacterium]